MFDFSLSGEFAQMLLRFVICFVVNLIIIDRLYYKKSHRRDFYFTYMLISIAIFFLVYFMIFVLEDMKGKTSMGIGIGLFGIFSIMRYRTDTMPVREMTYLFVIICLSVVNALGSTMSLAELLITNAIVVISIAICEARLKMMPCKMVQYDRPELTLPDREEELKADLEKRLGMKVIKIEVGGADLLRDTVMLKVYYEADNQHNSVDNITKMTTKMFTICLLAMMALPASAQSDDTETGLWLSTEVQKKLSKQWNVSAEAEYRLDDDLKNTDRWTLSAGAAYKPLSWLKLDAGYKFMRVQNDEETTYRADGAEKHFTPEWWCTKHRVYASVTGTLTSGRFDLSLRERWQYTYRPETTIQRYDYLEEDDWETKTKRSKSTNVLRSRLMAEYNIPHCKVDPFASAEIYHGKGGMQKIRYTAGVDWKPSKKHQFTAFYRYIDGHQGENNQHVIGLGYKLKL